MPIRSVAETLDSEELIGVYWEEVLTQLSATPNLMAVAVGEIVYARAINRIAEKSGVDRRIIWEAISGDGPITPTELEKIVHSMGLVSGLNET